MTITGGSVGASLGQNLKITSVGFNQDSKEKEGIIRNTVLGNVEIGQVSGDEINRDLSKANEITKDVHKTTNINIEPQLIEYTSNPTKFKEDLEVAVLEGKATGETVLKSIENVVNGGKEEIGDPERRSLNEIKETVIRVKTAPEMNLIATGDLNSQEVLNSLDINAIEKFNPDDPDLPENVRTRLDEVRRNGGEIEAFYDKMTNKIFINENVEDGETRALVAREWKISEDLKDGKGKANDEGQLKATVAGELAYDDMMKRAGEGKTGSISTDDLNVGVMAVDSEVTADKWERTKFVLRTVGNIAVDTFNATVQTGKATGNAMAAGYYYTTGNKKEGDKYLTRAKNNVKNVLEQPKETVKIIKKDYNETKDKIAKEKKTKKASPKKKTTKKNSKSNDKKNEINAFLDGFNASFKDDAILGVTTKIVGTVSERVVPYLLFSIPLNLDEDKYLGKFDTRSNSVKNSEVFGSILGGMVGFSAGSGITQIGSNAVKNSYRSLTNTNVSIMTKTESAIAKQGAIYLEEKNGVWEVTNNATPSIFKNKPALLPKTSTAIKMPSSSTLVPVLPLLKNNTSTNKEVYKKTTTRKEEPHSTVVKTSTKKGSTESPHSTGKTSSKSSTTGKETSRIIVTDIKIEKTNSEIPLVYMIDGMTKGGKEKTLGIVSGSYFKSYRSGKTFGSKESSYRDNDEGYKFNGNSGSSGNGNSSNSSKNQDSYYEGRKIYTGSELNQLGRGSNATPNRGVEYMFEKPAGKLEAQEFQWGLTGSMMQQTPSGPQNIIPALRYDNSNPRGMNFIKFDGIEVRNGTTYFIDTKRNVPYWNKSAMKNLTKTFRRINEAKNQNPEIKVIYEFPDEKAKGHFDKWLENNKFYEGTIDEIRIRK